jgi:hypothetical protein
MLAIQKADGDVRIFLNPVDLNKEVKRQQYPVPIAQELFARIGKAKYFSTLDSHPGSTNPADGGIQLCDDVRNTIRALSVLSVAAWYFFGTKSVPTDNGTVLLAILMALKFILTIFRVGRDSSGTRPVFESSI